MWHALFDENDKNMQQLAARPGAYSIKFYGSVNYGFVVTAKF